MQIAINTAQAVNEPSGYGLLRLYISDMALVQGIHCLAHGSKTEARHIAVDIQQRQRLLVGTFSMYGAGAYAWYAERLPDRLRDEPRVLFEIDDNAIVDICKYDGTSLGFFRIPGAIGDYVSIHVLAFNNLE